MRVTSSVLAGLVAIGQVSASPCSPYVVKPIKKIELGPRPYYLIDTLPEGPLKAKLLSCTEKTMKPSTWSIGHRGGGTLQIPEESRESIMAGTRMGAGIQECDVAFTKDRQLVCRHSQCDLHTTTNIVDVPELNAKCKTPFQPAADGKPAKAECCTSDITLDEYKSLCAKMDGANTTATNPADYLHGTPAWRTDLYATCAKVMTLQEHITLVSSLGLKFTPEIKTPMVEMPFDGDYTQEKYIQQIVDEFKSNAVAPEDTYIQSFLYSDIKYLLEKEPAFGNQAVLLDQSGDKPSSIEAATANLTNYAQDGVKIVAPPIAYLVTVEDGKLVPSNYAKKAKELGLKIITWSLDRSPPMAQVHEKGDYYYSTIQDFVKRDGDIYTVLDALWQQVGVFAVFSDWSATATYYANCFDIDL